MIASPAVFYFIRIIGRCAALAAAFLACASWGCDQVVSLYGLQGEPLHTVLQHDHPSLDYHIYDVLAVSSQKSWSEPDGFGFFIHFDEGTRFECGASAEDPLLLRRCSVDGPTGKVQTVYQPPHRESPLFLEAQSHLESYWKSLEGRDDVTAKDITDYQRAEAKFDLRRLTYFAFTAHDPAAPPFYKIGPTKIVMRLFNGKISPLGEGTPYSPAIETGPNHLTGIETEYPFIALREREEDTHIYDFGRVWADTTFEGDAMTILLRRVSEYLYYAKSPRGEIPEATVYIHTTPAGARFFSGPRFGFTVVYRPDDLGKNRFILKTTVRQFFHRHRGETLISDFDRFLEISRNRFGQLADQNTPVFRAY